MKTTSSSKTLFVAGCARSGTTALTRLLNSHPDIFVGTELFRSEFSSKSETFNHELLKSDKYQGKLAEMKESPTTLQYRGDKFPSYYSDYDMLFDRFDNVKVLFIFRNIFDVAQSYKARKIHPTNPWNKGVRRAIKEWNNSLELTIKHINEAKEIIPVIYEEILFKPNQTLKNILKLEPSIEFEKYYKKVTRDAKKIDANRPSILDNKEKLLIMEKSRFDLYKELLQMTLK